MACHQISHPPGKTAKHNDPVRAYIRFCASVLVPTHLRLSERRSIAVDLYNAHIVNAKLEKVLGRACCRLPAMKRLYGHRLGVEENRTQLSALAGATTIETIELRDSKLHIDDLLVILNPLKNCHSYVV
ncbi:hypothetical protein VE01_04193 [Pseudogymnoascus verrucosus]|uniref:Uncharacterized protein n=1 Tax=Pseudogymnoascus verrucosus TaxID=342668 RepID=A0A1B8GLH2_9PEZI|nr:uncharacterized protein VE01_04193 [Pseudogymnoascus verrucosus]OBT96682.1 hypothetical protein VE01_04193 [Pseudogymnoascus verrucosus]